MQWYASVDGQRLQERGLPQCKYYGSVKHDDPAALIRLSNIIIALDS